MAIGMAAASLGSLVVRLTADAQRLERGLTNAERKVESTSKRINQRLNRMTGISAAALAGVGVAATREFAKFDQAMTKSTAIMGDLSDDVQKEMRDTARSLSTEGVQSAEQLAESYFFLASAGLDAQQSIAALPQVQAFATAGAFDMATATDLLTDAQSALGLTVEDTTQNMINMARVSDVLVGANTLANATVEQFSTSLTREAGAALKSFNIDIEEGVAVLAAFADQGVKGEIAGTGLSRILRLLTQAANNNQEAMAELNFTVFDQEGKIRNLADIVENLEKSLGGMSDQQRTAALEAIGFTARVQGILLPLLGTSDAIREYEEALRNAGGLTGEVADKQLQSFSNQLQITLNVIQNAAIGIGENLAPEVESLAQDLREALNENDQVVESITKLSGAIFRVVGLIARFTFLVLKNEKAVSTMEVAIQLLFARMIALTTAGIIRWIGSLAVSLKNATAAMTLLNATVRANPFGAFVAVVSTVVGALTAYALTTRKASEVQDVMVGSSEDLAVKLARLRGETEELTRATLIRSLTETEQQIQQVGRSLDQLSPQYRRLQNDLQNVENLYNAGQISTAEYEARNRRLRGELEEVEEQISEYGNQLSSLQDIQGEVTEQIEELDNRVANAAKSFNDASDSILGFGRNAGLVIDPNAMNQFAGAADNARGSIESLRQQLRGMRSEFMDSPQMPGAGGEEQLTRLDPIGQQALLAQRPEGLRQGDQIQALTQRPEELQAQFDEQKRIILESEKGTAEQREALILEMEERLRKKQQEAIMARNRMVLQTSQGMFEDLASIAKDFEGEQSGIFKAMFAVSKAFAIADSIVKIQQGIANAASLPFPANLGAMATVVSATAGIVSSIRAVQMQGFEGGGFTTPGRSRSGGADGRGGFAALLHPDEFVIDLKDQDSILQASNLLNGFQGGGFTSDLSSMPSGGGTDFRGNRKGSSGEAITVAVNITNEVGGEVDVRPGADAGSIEVAIRRSEERVAQNIRDGRGPVPRSIERAFKIRRK